MAKPDLSGWDKTRSKGELLEQDVEALGKRKEDQGANVWDRLKGETPNQYAAFEVYRQLNPWQRSVREVQRQLNKKTNRSLYEWSTKNHWKARAVAWDEHQAFVQQEQARAAIRRSAEAHCRTLDYVQAIADMHLARIQRQVAGELEGNPDVVPNYLNARELINWVKNGQQLEDAARMRMVTVNAKTVSALMALGNGAPATVDQWRALYVEPERTWIPHPKQRELIHSTQRFIASIAGVQSGKTSGSAIAFWKRVLDERPTLHSHGEVGFYWLVAPNSIVGEVMCEAFEQYAPPEEIIDRKGSHSGKTWTLSDGSRVQFRSAEKADTLVARRLHGVWLDEFTLLKKEVWTTSVRQRLATTGGWALFSGTPRGKNWAWDEIWRRCDPDDDLKDPDYNGFTWWSEENPAIDQGEIEAARRQLPEPYFEREYRASWEAFHGQIYSYFDESSMVVDGLSRRSVPTGTVFLMGVDWGHAKPGAAVVLAKLPTGRFWIVDEVHEAEKLPGWWDEEITRLWKKWRVDRIWCDPEDPGRIATLVELGLPARAANNQVGPGIRRVASLYKQRRILIDKACKITIKQTNAYHWKEDARGNRLEVPAKENDHAVDGKRYAIHSDETRDPAPEQFGYGGAKPKRRR